MYRSVSTSRVTDDGYYSIYNQSPTSKTVSPVLRALALEANELPQYEPSPFSSISKKDKLGRGRFSDKAVHIIPLVLLLCALVLWLFSNPDINMPIKDNINAANIKEKRIREEVDHSHAMSQFENSQGVGVVDLGLPKHEDGHKLATTIENKL